MILPINSNLYLQNDKKTDISTISVVHISVFVFVA